ncbi:hypothetical protein SCUCBS95973_002231 [Sporothrix curviconia]|uniref:Uncharacterized protein n=1 Tax=Sporothrix curviconia TaxID=1260050 RepID=A0ABP0B5D2_9PEZI
MNQQTISASNMNRFTVNVYNTAANAQVWVGGLRGRGGRGRGYHHRRSQEAQARREERHRRYIAGGAQNLQARAVPVVAAVPLASPPFAPCSVSPVPRTVSSVPLAPAALAPRPVSPAPLPPALNLRRPCNREDDVRHVCSASAPCTF